MILTTNNNVWRFLQVLLLLPTQITNIFVEFAKRTFLLVPHYKFTCELIQETVLLAARSAENPSLQKAIWRYKNDKQLINNMIDWQNKNCVKGRFEFMCFVNTILLEISSNAASIKLNCCIYRNMYNLYALIIPY